MATTRDYTEYLNTQVDIAPATSAEELAAAEAIQQLMGAHGLDARMQEFDAPAWAGLPYRVLMVVLFVGIFLAGLQGTPVAVAGIVVTLVVVGVFVARYLGYDLVSNIGPRARSQNVVAVRRASGPLADKANRPIVVVAHYDTPRDNFMYAPQMAAFRPLVGRMAPVLVLVVGACGLLQLLAGVLAVVCRVIWIVGIVAALPLLLLGVSSVAERFAPCTDGANDNKSGVAALLGVMAKVAPAADAADGAFGAGGVTGANLLAPGVAVVDAEQDAAADGTDTPADADAAGPGRAPTPVMVEEYEEVVGVRHGSDVLAELHILPEGCEIVYREPRVVKRVSMEPIDRIGVAADAPVAVGELDDDEPLVPVSDLAARGATAARNVAGHGRALFGRLTSRLGRGKDAAGNSDAAPAPTAGTDGAPEGTAGNAAASDAAAGEMTASIATDTTRDDGANAADDTTVVPSRTGRVILGDVPVIERGVASDVTFSKEGDPSDSEVASRDDSGLAAMGDVYDRPAPRDGAPTPRPPAVDDRSWGTSDLAPKGGGDGFARRAVLFDLPDPSASTNDPFATDPSRAPLTSRDVAPAGGADGGDEKGVTSPLATTDSPAPVQVTGDLPLLRPLDGRWKGGATNRSGLRVVDGGENEDELREALREQVTGGGDDALAAHDVWFVALGASGRGHAGMAAFLDEHRRQMRGAFVINLSCVGAGALTLYTREGIDNPRRADRRLERLVSGVGADLGIALDKRELDWGTTDATVAMRSSVRAISVVGLDDAGVPALARTADDVAGNVDPAAVDNVARMVCEVIRRS